MLRHARKYAKALDQYYRYDPEEGTLTFEDKVTYTLAEAIVLSRRKESDEDVGKIHLVKKHFNGLIEDSFRIAQRVYGVSEADKEVLEARIVPAVREVGGKRKQVVPDACQMRLEI